MQLSTPRWIIRACLILAKFPDNLLDHIQHAQFIHMQEHHTQQEMNHLILEDIQRQGSSTRRAIVV